VSCIHAAVDHWYDVGGGVARTDYKPVLSCSAANIRILNKNASQHNRRRPKKVEQREKSLGEAL
jgi:hypothetical protein